MGDLFFYSLIGTVAGIALFVWGFFQLRKKRIIENLPTSKIRSMAMGLVEIKGIAVDWNPLTSPFSQRSCVYYRYMVEELRRSKNSTYWASIHKGASETSPFFIQDDTGNALVHPQGAEIDIPESFTLKTGMLQDIPGHVVEFLDQRNVRYKGFLGTSKTLRFREWHIEPSHEVYILGVCKTPGVQLASKYRERLIEVLRKAKADPNVMKQFDLNGDGKISADEWELARQTIQQKLSEKFNEEPQVYIGKGKHRHEMFYISKKSEKALVSELHFSAMAGVFGGAIMTCACLWYVLHMLRV